MAGLLVIKNSAMVQGVDFKFMSCLLLLAQGSIKIYKLPLPKDLDDHTIMGFDPQFGFFQVRIYIFKMKQGGTVLYTYEK